MTQTSRRTDVYSRGGVVPPAMSAQGKRQISYVGFGSVPGANANLVIFTTPTKSKIESIEVFPNASMYHAANEADTWTFSVLNAQSGAATLNAQAASLSGVTLAATAYKSIPINNGNATIESGVSLMLKLVVSGTPQTLSHLAVRTVWHPIGA